VSQESGNLNGKYRKLLLRTCSHRFDSGDLNNLFEDLNVPNEDLMTRIKRQDEMGREGVAAGRSVEEQYLCLLGSPSLLGNERLVARFCSLPRLVPRTQTSCLFHNGQRYPDPL